MKRQVRYADFKLRDKRVKELKEETESAARIF